MFTGIVEEVGIIEKIDWGASSAILTIRAKDVLEGTRLGDSIAVNGICLTVTSLGAGCFTADVMHETLNRSSMKQAAAGTRVNLERAMKAENRFGGHIVSGHVDGVGTVAQITRDDNAIWYKVLAGPNIMKYVVEKGSITIDGISLTVAKVDKESFEISAIPHTVSHTILKDRNVGSSVNLETDIIGKYVEKLLGLGDGERGDAAIDKSIGGAGTVGSIRTTGKGGAEGSNITMEYLAKYGF